MSRAIDTERLVLHQQTIVRPDDTGGATREVYQGWLKMSAGLGDVPKPVVTVTIGFGNFLEWIEVDSFYRRQGLGTEALKKIEGLIGEVEAEGVTDLGRLFCKSLEE